LKAASLFKKLEKVKQTTVLMQELKYTRTFSKLV